LENCIERFYGSAVKRVRDTNIKVISIEPGYMASNLNQDQGIRTTKRAAGIIVKHVALPDIATGQFFDRNRNELGW